MKHGIINTASEVPGSGFRSGSASITALLTSIDITFSSALADANYLIFLFMSGIAVAFTISNKATTGFTIGFSVGISGTINYLVVPVI